MGPRRITPPCKEITLLADGGRQLRPIAVRSPGVGGSVRLVMDVGDTMRVRVGGSRSTRASVPHSPATRLHPAYPSCNVRDESDVC